MNLTEAELRILRDKEFLQTKIQLTKSIIKELELIGRDLKVILSQLPSGHILSTFQQPSPKVSRGENYQSLPYFVLDYPRSFENKDIVAIRNIILWGSSISTSLLVSGAAQKNISKKIVTKWERLSDHDNCFICVNDSPWEHHYKENNYLNIKELNKVSFGEIIQNHSFLKISFRLNIDDIIQSRLLMIKNFKEFISLLD